MKIISLVVLLAVSAHSKGFSGGGHSFSSGSHSYSSGSHYSSTPHFSAPEMHASPARVSSSFSGFSSRPSFSRASSGYVSRPFFGPRFFGYGQRNYQVAPSSGVSGYPAQPSSGSGDAKVVLGLIIVTVVGILLMVGIGGI